MDPRNRADEALARARARGAFVVTPDNATSPMDASNTVRIPRSIVDAVGGGTRDPESTVVLSQEERFGGWPRTDYHEQSTYGYGDQGRGNYGYGDQGYPDQGHGYGDQGRSEQGYSDQGWGDPGWGDQARGDRRYGDYGRGDHGYGEYGRGEQASGDRGQATGYQDPPTYHQQRRQGELGQPGSQTSHQYPHR